MGKDFNVFLMRRLTAAKEAQERHEREKRREERRFLKQVFDEAAKSGRGSTSTNKSHGKGSVRYSSK